MKAFLIASLILNVLLIGATLRRDTKSVPAQFARSLLMAVQRAST